VTGHSDSAAGLYAFGHDEVAARRLELVHELLAPASRALLGEVAGLGRFEVVFDLGCGPGLTSRLLGEVLRPGLLVGLDLSESFLQLARAAVPGGEFIRQDIRTLPWPRSPVDLAYSRYVLTHLPDPEARLREWMSQLRPDGLLVIEENEWIACYSPVFAHYLEIAGELLAGRGHDLYVGRRLATVEPRHRRISRVFEVLGPTAQVATMFRLNLRAWGAQTDLSRGVDVAMLDRDLAELEGSAEPAGITWGLRQLVFTPPP
jgi:SAM-dependent methyltransferase